MEKEKSEVLDALGNLTYKRYVIDIDGEEKSFVLKSLSIRCLRALSKEIKSLKETGVFNFELEAFKKDNPVEIAKHFYYYMMTLIEDEQLGEVIRRILFIVINNKIPYVDKVDDEKDITIEEIDYIDFDTLGCAFDGILSGRGSVNFLSKMQLLPELLKVTENKTK